MLWIYAASYVARMTKHFAMRNLATGQLIRDSMRLSCFAIVPYKTVAILIKAANVQKTASIRYWY